MPSQSKRAQARAQKRQQEQRRTAGLLILAGLAVLVTAGFLISNSIKAKPKVAEFDYTEADIEYGEPIHAIHEMTGAALDEISFLPKDGPQPQIAVSETTHGFGEVGATEVVTYDFVIKNVGDAPLTITRAYTTCGCTTADFTASVIPPGKVTIMTLVFDAGYHDLSGQSVRRGVIIENNDPNVPELELWVSAKVANN